MLERGRRWLQFSEETKVIFLRRPLLAVPRSVCFLCWGDTFGMRHRKVVFLLTTLPKLSLFFLLNCNNAMEVLLSLPIVIAVRDDEIVLDSGSEVHPLTPEATFYICSRRSFGDFVLHLLFDEDAYCVVREQQQVLRYWGYRVGSQ